jgi:hypothetical protein
MERSVLSEKAQDALADFRIESLLLPPNLHYHSFAYIQWQAQGKAKASPNKIVRSQGQRKVL